MRWTTTLTVALLATALAVPAAAQEGHEGMEHGEKKGHEMEGHGEMQMRMHHSMADMMEKHAEALALTDEQMGRIEALDERMEAEKERHHAEMRAIHEAAMEVLSDEQRERLHGMMEAMHEGGGHGDMDRHGEKKDHAGHGEAKKKDDGDYEHEDEEDDDHDH